MKRFVLTDKATMSNCSITRSHKYEEDASNEMELVFPANCFGRCGRAQFENAPIEMWSVLYEQGRLQLPQAFRIVIEVDEHTGAGTAAEMRELGAEARRKVVADTVDQVLERCREVTKLGHKEVLVSPYDIRGCDDSDVRRELERRGFKLVGGYHRKMTVSWEAE